MFYGKYGFDSGAYCEMRLIEKHSRNNLFNVVFSSEKAYPKTQTEITVEIQAKRRRAISP